MLAFFALNSAESAKYEEEKQFVNWMRDFGCAFSGEEYQARLEVWRTNMHYVTEHNEQSKGFTLKLNKFAHLTNAEYNAYLGYKASSKKKSYSSSSSTVKSIDWRKKGIVNAIKDQGNCGSCWAFSAIQAQESQWAKVYGKLYKLSEQNLVDCVTTCYGCDGGYTDYTYDYVIAKQSGKFMLSSAYPYTGVDGTCKFKSSKGVTYIKGYISVTRGSETDLAAKVAIYGPASIGIDASHYSFMLYGSGIYNEPSCSTNDLDHAVGCVGFGYSGSTNYWIVRNSWGIDWGEQGYIRMIRGKNNRCGVATEAIIPKDK